MLFGSSTGRDGIGGASVLASAELGDRRGQAPDGPGRRPVRGEEGAGVLAGAAGARAARLAAGPGRRRPDVVVGGDGVQGRGRPRPRRRQRAAARGRHGAVRDHGQRVAGAHALRLRARSRRRGARGLREVGGPRRPRSAWSPTAGGCGVLDGDDVVGDVPVAALVDDCPLYDLEPGARRRRRSTRAPAAHARRRARTLARRCWRCSRSPNIASRLPLFQQYDWIVQSRTVRRPGEADAAVLRLPAGNAIAVAIDGSGRRVAGRPVHAARSRTCSSAPRTSRASAPSRSG